MVLGHLSAVLDRTVAGRPSCGTGRTEENSMADEPRVREFNFGPGNPDPGVFPAAELGAAAQRVLSRAGAELAHYPDPLGMPELRAVAAERFERNHGVRPRIEDVVITNGAM